MLQKYGFRELAKIKTKLCRRAKK